MALVFQGTGQGKGLQRGWKFSEEPEGKFSCLKKETAHGGLGLWGPRDWVRA